METKMKFKNIAIVFALLTAVLFAPSYDTVARIPVSNTLSDFIVKYEPLYMGLFTSQQDSPTTYRIVKFGYNLDLDAGANEDVWSKGGLFVTPSGAETLNVASSSEDDGSGTGLGTGAETVFITGIGSGGGEITESVTLNGSTDVETTNTWLFVNRTQVTLSGTGLTNAGNISLTQSSSGVVLGYIPLGTSITQQAMYQVPSGRICYVVELHVHAEKQVGADPQVIFFVKAFDDSQNTERVARRDMLDTDGHPHGEFDEFMEVPLEVGDRISIEADSDKADTEISAHFDLICRDI